MVRNYKSNEERVKEFIETKLISSLKNNDLDYNKVILGMAMDLNVKKELVMKMLQSYSEINKIGIYISIPSDEIVDWLKNERKVEEEVESIREINIGGKKK